jgi:hypothetical protein
MTRKNGKNGGKSIINNPEADKITVKKKILLYILLLTAAVLFIFYTFQVKNRSEKEEPVPASAGIKKEIRQPKKRYGFRLPHFQQAFVPYKGEVKIQHDIKTPNLRGTTGLDFMQKQEISTFRLQKVSIYRQLGIYDENYHPFKDYHRYIYKSITPGEAWLGPTPYYIANPYQLVVLTCANHVTPLNLYCPDVQISYSNGVFEAVHRGKSALCWFRMVYESHDYPGQVWPISINAWDAGFFYTFVDLSRSKNIKENHNPGHITNKPLTRRYFYHVGKYKKNNISPTIKEAWLTLINRDTRTVIYIKLWRNKPTDNSQAPDLVWVFKILP